MKEKTYFYFYTSVHYAYYIYLPISDDITDILLLKVFTLKLNGNYVIVRLTRRYVLKDTSITFLNS